MNTPWQILVIDDEVEICKQIQRHFEEEKLDDTERTIQITAKQDFKEAVELLETQKIDAIILDVRAEGEPDAGIKTLNKIKETRFVPIVFYTANPNYVNELITSVIRVVEKTEGLDAIHSALKEMVSTGIPAANRAILRHVEHVQRDFMWNSHEILSAYHQEPDKLSIAFLMARRLAASLESTGVGRLAKDMGYSGDQLLDGDTVHPMYFYIIPPIQNGLHTGALYRESDNKFWVILSNACDLELRPVKNEESQFYRKADHILLAECLPIQDQNEHEEWSSKKNKKTIANFRKLIANNRDGGQPERYFFLPAALGFSDLLVDVQSLKAVTAEMLEEMTPLAIIDSPFRESLISRFTRFYSRIGTPNINVEVILDRLAQPDS